MSEPTRSFVPPPQEGSSSARQPLTPQTVGASASAAPSSLPQAQMALLNAGPATQLPDSPMSSVSHPATSSITSSRATDPAAGSPGTRSSERWDCQSPPHQQPRAPNTQSQDASAFLSTPSCRRICPRMRPIPTDSDEELLAPKAPPAAPSTASPAAPPTQHLFVDLTRSSQLSSSTAAPSQQASGAAAPAQPAPGTPATGQPESQEGSVIDMTDSSKPTPHLRPVDSAVNRNVHITTTASGQMLAADKLAHSKSGRPILNAQEYWLSSGGDLLPFFELSSGPAGAPTLANTPSPTGGSSAFSPPPMEFVLDFSKNAAPAGELSAPSGSKTLNAHGCKSNPPAPKAPKSAARKVDPPAKPPAKRPRTSSKVEAAAAGLSERRKKDLDVPLESDEDVEMEDGATDEGEGEDDDNGNGVQKSNRFGDELRRLVLSWWFALETYVRHCNNKGESLKELVTLIGGVKTKRQLSNFINAALRRYRVYNRLAMRTGGGKDDRVTRDEMEARYYQGGGDKYKFEYWLNYGDSYEFNVIHEVLWDSDDVRKFMHLDLATSVLSDDELDDAPAANDTPELPKSKCHDPCDMTP
ncbi:hypothetical protein FRC08_013673 [Ceratobasidium sp. 394]|nr:hypothetical protein FRC08_013673 [Ceratobasidium sp. 394]